MSRGCFVTGTGTGVGKTVLAATIVAGLRRRGVDALGLKPLLTGLDEPADPGWPADHELLARVGHRPAAEVVLRGFAPPVSPHLAAAMAGIAITLDELVAFVAQAAGKAEATVVEGVGGLLVPLGPGLDVADLACALGYPIVIAAAAGLGTINHTLLTLEAARGRGLRVAAVVLGPWKDPPGSIERSNRETIAALGEVPVFTLPRLVAGEPGELAEAAAALPLEDWLGAGEIGSRGDRPGKAGGRVD